MYTAVYMCGTKPLLSSSDGARCYIAEIANKKQNEIINRKTELCHHRPQTKAHINEYENYAQGRTNPTGFFAEHTHTNCQFIFSCM